MAVDRCVCFDLTFRELHSIASERTLSFEQLVDHTGCCTGCSSCEPYIRRMLETGETDFPVFPVDGERDRA